MNILVISDNEFLVENFVKIIEAKELNLLHNFAYMCSYNNKNMSLKGYDEISVKKDWERIIKGEYELVFSLHCKQIFPESMVKAIRCVNIHPGYNPYNRGWFPQVFSIMNKLPLGATIHEIDAQLDHGAIIAQKKVEVLSSDTSLTAYNKVLDVELELIRENISSIIDNNYSTKKPEIDGNVNLKKDFNDLLKIDLNEIIRAGDFIDKLRALTHGEYKNAYFEDSNGDIIYIGVSLSKRNNE